MLICPETAKELMKQKVQLKQFNLELTEKILGVKHFNIKWLFFQNQDFQEKLSVSSKFSSFFIGNKYFLPLLIFFFLPLCTLLSFASECSVKANV